MDYESLYATATKALNTQLEISATQTNRIAELEAIVATKVICHVESCSCRAAGVCKATIIRLQPCTPDADNVVGCSEFKEK